MIPRVSMAQIRVLHDIARGVDTRVKGPVWKALCRKGLVDKITATLTDLGRKVVAGNIPRIAGAVMADEVKPNLHESVVRVPVEQWNHEAFLDMMVTSIDRLAGKGFVKPTAVLVTVLNEKEIGLITISMAEVCRVYGIQMASSILQSRGQLHGAILAIFLTEIGIREAAPPKLYLPQALEDERESQRGDWKRGIWLISYEPAKRPVSYTAEISDDNLVQPFDENPGDIGALGDIRPCL